jgi:hypothetical protein
MNAVTPQYLIDVALAPILVLKVISVTSRSRHSAAELSLVHVSRSSRLHVLKSMIPSVDVTERRTAMDVRRSLKEYLSLLKASVVHPLVMTLT